MPIESGESRYVMVCDRGWAAMKKVAAVIVGVGERDGLGAHLARRFGEAGYGVALLGRHEERLAPILQDLRQADIEALMVCGDTREEVSVARLFDRAERELGPVKIVCFNAGARVQGPIADVDPAKVKAALDTGIFGAFLVGRAAAHVMLGRQEGSILFTGATASLRGYAGSAAFAMSKFALRGLAQSMARELGPQGIHVSHIVIDGAIASARMKERLGERYQSADIRYLEARDIAETYYQLAHQPRSAWTFELELRPWLERF
jgi:NAD(P)-dependent dehydrogenase (short-subunit alcohol dehydrogenase family)